MMADHGGRHWVQRANPAKGYPQTVLRSGDCILVAECFEGPQYPALFTDHIVTFDLPTVLALVRELQHLRASVGGSEGEQE